MSSIIDRTPVQLDLIGFKRRLGLDGFDEDLRLVGAGYWRGFMRRNKHKIVSKKG